MTTKPLRRPNPGRPPLSLREDPDRYVIAYFLARRWAYPDESEASLMRHIAQVHHGAIDSPEEADAYIAAILRGSSIRLKPKTFERKGRDDPEAEQWRDRDSANAWATDYLKKCRAVGERLTRNPDANTPDSQSGLFWSDADASGPQSDLFWYANMMNAWYFILKPEAHHEPLVVARHFAVRAEEADYFETEMKPYFFRFFNFFVKAQSDEVWSARSQTARDRFNVERTPEPPSAILAQPPGNGPRPAGRRRRRRGRRGAAGSPQGRERP